MEPICNPRTVNLRVECVLTHRTHRLAPDRGLLFKIVLTPGIVVHTFNTQCLGDSSRRLVSVRPVSPDQAEHVARCCF